MATNEINLENIVLILRRRAWLIANVFVAAVLIAGAITYQSPKMYRATTLLNFDFRGENPLDNRGRTILSADSYLTTQIGILESLNVAEKVVDGLTEYERERVIMALDASHSSIDRFIYNVRQFGKSLFISSDTGKQQPIPATDLESAGSSQFVSVRRYGWLTKSIGSALEVYPQVNSRIVDVSYLSTDRQIAAMLADKFAEAYIETSLQMIIEPAKKSKVWFDEQLKSLRKHLEDAQARLTAYQQQEGIVSSDQRINIESSKLAGLTEQLVAAQQVTRNAASEKAKLQEVLDRGDSLETYEPVFRNSIVQNVKSEIRALEGKLVENSNSLGENHPRIRKLKSELAAARGRLRHEINTIIDGIDNASELSGEREQALEQVLMEQKKLVLELKSEHDKIMILQREVDSSQTAYNAALNQLNTTSMQSLVDQTNVSVVDHASIPGVHSTPRLTKNLAVGAFGGLLLGIGMALFMELFVRRVHSKEDIISDIGIPLLGHLRKY